MVKKTSINANKLMVNDFSTQNKSTRFVEYIGLEVLPQLHSIAELDVQSQVLKTLGEACTNSSEVRSFRFRYM